MKLKKLLKIYDEKYSQYPSSHEEQLEYIRKMHKIDLNKIKDMQNHINDIPWYTQKFTFDIMPYPAHRPKAGANGHFYVEGAHEHWKYMQDAIKNSEIIHTATKFELVVYLPIPSGMSASEKYLAQMGYINPIGGGDWDNFGKTYSDAIQEILILNDNLIIEGLVTKKYALKPRVEIIIKYQLDYDSNFNRRKVEGTKSYKNIISN